MSWRLVATLAGIFSLYAAGYSLKIALEYKDASGFVAYAIVGVLFGAEAVASIAVAVTM